MQATVVSYAERLVSNLSELEEEFTALVEASTINYVNPNRPGSGVVHIGASNWGWAPSDTGLQLRRGQLLERYLDWYHRFDLLIPVKVPEITKAVSEADGLIRRWLERAKRFDRSIPKDTPSAVGRARWAFGVLRELIETAARGGKATTYLVPDANALIDNPDLADYAVAGGVQEGVIYLVPTVLGELDELKVRAHQDRRGAAERAIKVIKGLRDRGDLSRGVPVAGKVTAQATGFEPDVRAVLATLDPTVPDDRIVASALKLQSGHPAAVVVLITRDINLTTKADLVGLPVIATPKRSTESADA